MAGAVKKSLASGRDRRYLACMSTPPPFIACGMYAFTPELRSAWDALLRQYHDVAGLAGDPPPVEFDTDESMLRDPAMLFGHTCGYPLMTRLRDAVTPVCVPEFDVPGCEDHLYASRFVVPAESGIDSLGDCQGQVVAVNTVDSNSGMNVLRYALAKIGARAPWFEQVELTGGHRYSLEAVAAGRAQLAAIDCVSYQLVMDIAPHLAGAVRTIAFSRRSPGLPLVIPARHTDDFDRNGFTADLNLALAALAPGQRASLHIRRFRPVDLADYEIILQMEQFAIERGYAQLK